MRQSWVAGWGGVELAGTRRGSQDARWAVAGELHAPSRRQAGSRHSAVRRPAQAARWRTPPDGAPTTRLCNPPQRPIPLSTSHDKHVVPCPLSLPHVSSSLLRVRPAHEPAAMTADQHEPTPTETSPLLRRPSSSSLSTKSAQTAVSDAPDAEDTRISVVRGTVIIASLGLIMFLQGTCNNVYLRAQCFQWSWAKPVSSELALVGLCLPDPAETASAGPDRNTAAPCPPVHPDPCSPARFSLVAFVSSEHQLITTQHATFRY